MDRGEVDSTREPVPKLPHLEDPRFELELVGERSGSLPGVFVFRDVLEELCYRAVYEPVRMSACLLTGGWYVGPYGPYVEIDGFRDTTFVEDTLRFLHHLRSDPGLLMDDRDGLVVGCCLLLPGSHGKMAADELILLNTFFNLPQHILLAIDGEQDAFGFYARDENDRFHNAAAYIVAEASASQPTLDPEDGSVVGKVTDPDTDSTEQPSSPAEPLASMAPSSTPREDAQPPVVDIDAQRGEDDDGDR